MKKLLIAAAVMALTTGANAQDVAGKDAKEGTIGGVATTTVAAGVVGVAVAAAVISNNRGSSIDAGTDPVDPTDTCNPGDAAPVNGVCTGTTVTGAGTTTSTVTFTYPAISG